MTERSRRSRRSTEAVRESLLEAAATEFESRGYAATTLRAVADRADVSLSVLHRHYASKPRLFAAALVVPFTAFIEDFAGAWAAQDDEPWDDRRLMERLVAGLYGHLLSHRRTLEGLVAARAEESGELVVEIRTAFADLLAALDRIGEREADRRGWFTRDAARVVERLVIATTIGAVVTRDWLPSGDDAGGDPDRATVDQIVRLALYGIALEPRGVEPGAT